MNPKIKLLTLLFVFIISLCLSADYIFSAFLTKTTPVAESNKIYRLTNEQHNNEIPIFGSSRAEKGYYCDNINPNCYNYGFPNQSFDVTALLLNFELKKNKTTPIIIDIHHDFFQHNAYTNINLATYLPFVNTNDSITAFLEQNNRLKPYHYIPGARYFGYYTTYLEPIVENKMKIGNALYVKGGVFDTKKGDSRSIQKRIDNRLDKKLSFTITSENDKQLKQLITSSPDRKFIFVVSPYHWSAKSTVANFDEMLNYFNGLAKSYPNVHFIFFNTDKYSDELFKDTVHLNEAGAKQFSAELQTHLQELEIF